MDGWVEQLVGRGVDRPHAVRLVGEHDSERIADAIAYFDALTHGEGPGVLVMAIKEGRKPRRSIASIQERQVAYGEEIVAWLRQHFPQYNREQGNRTHAGAIACVIRLRQRHGWPLSATERGAEIRRAVQAFDRRLLGEGAS